MGLLLGGCATAPAGVTAPDAMASAALPSNPVDPFERWNRNVFGFNEALDENVLVPVATAYQSVVPSLVRKGISNVFNNVADAWSAINALLQGKLETSMRDMMRFLVNTTFGFAGALDIAREMGLEPHYEDFGQTLGTWGVASGPYIVWPVLGPSALRESIALPLDRSVTPAVLLNDGRRPGRADGAAGGQCARQPARRLARAGRHRAGQVQLHPRWPTWRGGATWSTTATRRSRRTCRRRSVTMSPKRRRCRPSRRRRPPRARPAGPDRSASRHAGTRWLRGGANQACPAGSKWCRPSGR